MRKGRFCGLVRNGFCMWFSFISLADLPNDFLFTKIRGEAFPSKRHSKKSLRDKTLNILSVLSQSLSRNKDLFYDSQEIWDDLASRGYSEEEIESAVTHIERTSLNVPGSFWSDVIPVHRIYTPEESYRLSTKVRGYLWRLKCRGVIDH